MVENNWGSKPTRPLSYCRDIESHLQVSGSTEAEASLTGLVTAARSSGKIRFFDLRDVTGAVQFIANKGDFSEEDWNSFPSLKAGMRVSACGKIGKSKTGQTSVFLSRLPIVHSEILASPIAGTPPDYARVGQLMFVATEGFIPDCAVSYLLEKS